MQLEFSADQEDLRASVRSVLEHECGIDTVRQRVEKGQPATAAWRRMQELGWPALTLPEAAGGLGLGPVEVAVVAEELGRVVAPVPWLPTVTQYAALVREAGSPEQQEALLGPVAEGRVTATAALAEDGHRALPARPAVTAEPAGRDWRLTGAKRWVWEASAADEIAVVAAAGGGLGVFVVPAAEAVVAPVQSVDASRELASVTFDGVKVTADRVLGDPGSAAVARAVSCALEEAVTALALEVVGTCSTLLEMTLGYVKTRHQFGVPIGSFQAVKHKLADSYVALERARAAAYFAAACLAEDDPRRAEAVAMAKVAAGDCQQRVVQDAIQCHGGIGYTWESDVHLYAKRAKAGALLLGTTGEHRARLATLLGVGA